MRPLLHCAVLLLAALPCPAPAQELAALRPLAVVEEPMLRLGDLFEGAGARAGQPIGAAPAPGRRLVLEAPQLFALARAHGLIWRPLSAHERVVVERPGRAVPRDEIEAMLRAELLRLGLDPEAELDLGTLPPPMVPPTAALQLAIEAASFDPTSNRFAAILVVMAEGMPTARLRLAGRALATQPVVLATRRLALGEVIGPGDLRLVRLRAERVRPGAAQHPGEVVGRQLRRPMAGDMPFMAADLAAPSLVEKNALVTMLLEAPGLSLSAQGRALEAAPRGGLVPVMNLASRSIVEGQVIGPNRVRVAMGATPISR
ncbi:flagellar basal body P-ring formation chaperone FlgA [Siccirubricoccus sp. G192]|uniref:flagellar basal body P-ring formation chaperone FlgA n=1 Tax=Siccirubricoccus sp. G192 TaxID=2849651 RepID=UPI001C2C6DB4|nr:flagellar basal body P-ring formation chaperone FlgA [Siccirubricoccus sp. G192]MBV1797969.1 flagellar basal body P-ring formation chaperone FlgA [Siccirubricoccus sp. G192]